MQGGKGVELARKASVVLNIIVTGRPSLARKAAELQKMSQAWFKRCLVERTLVLIFHPQ